MYIKTQLLSYSIKTHIIRSCSALAALAGSQLRTSHTNRQQPSANNQTHEMTVPNELIGCIIGKGGTKIAEIRQISGAMIRISNCEEREGGATDRTITITGNPDAVALAQYLINMRWVFNSKPNVKRHTYILVSLKKKKREKTNYTYIYHIRKLLAPALLLFADL